MRVSICADTQLKRYSCDCEPCDALHALRTLGSFVCVDDDAKYDEQTRTLSWTLYCNQHEELSALQSVTDALERCFSTHDTSPPPKA